jgi:hypothetical protein
MVYFKVLKIEKNVYWDFCAKTVSYFRSIKFCIKLILQCSYPFLTDCVNKGWPAAGCAKGTVVLIFSFLVCWIQGMPSPSSGHTPSHSILYCNYSSALCSFCFFLCRSMQASWKFVSSIKFYLSFTLIAYRRLATPRVLFCHKSGDTSMFSYL